MTTCRTCELTDRRDAGEAPPWDDIVSTSGWDVAHAFGTHVIPRARDLPATQVGPAIFSRVGLADDACVTEARMTQIATGLRTLLRADGYGNG